ncbi:MAG: ABC transporter ATP-binding protein [Opitutales bacterium]
MQPNIMPFEAPPPNDDLERPFLELTQLRKVYDTAKGPAVILDDMNLKVRKGEFIALIGHSGCGKSTALTMVAGLNAISGGGIVLQGKEVAGPGPDRGVVFQSPCLLPWMSAYDNVMLGVKQVFFHASRKQRRAIVEHFLCRVGLADAMHKRPSELSNGMKQRVGIARAFALNPKMLLLDEPFGMLDQLTKFELQDVLLDLWSRDQKTALMVTHDVDEAIFLADRVVMMTNGPAARVGDILDIDYPRPRERARILEDANYQKYREHLISFLENCELEKDKIAREKREQAEAAKNQKPGTPEKSVA